MKDNKSFNSGKKGIFCRKNNGEFFQESFYFRLSREISGSDMLNNRTFGESSFFPGGKFFMNSSYWVIQLQLTGEAVIRCENTSRRIYPGDLLVVPPRTKYTYIINEPMTKFFITLHHSALLDILLRGEVEKYGIWLHCQEGNDYTGIFNQIKSSMLSRDDEECSVLIYRLIYRLRDEFTSYTQTGNFRQKLKNAVGKIELMTSLDMLAAEFNMPKHTLIRTFHRELGTSPINYMITMRLEHAKQLLSFSELSISEIASACGYASPAFFTSEFRKRFGVAPTIFRSRNFTKQQ